MALQCASVSKGVLGNDMCALRAGHDGSHRNERGTHLWSDSKYDHQISRRIASLEARLAALAAAGDALAGATDRVVRAARTMGRAGTVHVLAKPLAAYRAARVEVGP